MNTMVWTHALGCLKEKVVDIQISWDSLLLKKSPLNMSWRRVSSTQARWLQCRSQIGQTAHAVSGEKPGLFFDQPAQLWPSMHRCMNYFTQHPIRNTCTFRCKQLRWGEERGGLVQKVIQVMFSYFCFHNCVLEGHSKTWCLTLNIKNKNVKHVCMPNSYVAVSSLNLRNILFNLLSLWQISEIYEVSTSTRPKWSKYRT